MRIRSIGLAIVTAVLLWSGVGVAAPEGRLIEITGNDQMKYSVAVITAKPGELLHVRLKSLGTLPKIAMAHNFVLLAKGTDPAAFTNASATASTTGYIPAQFKAKKGPFALGLSAWMARANNSLPVPLSPVINTVASVTATSQASRFTSCICGETLMM